MIGPALFLVLAAWLISKSFGHDRTWGARPTPAKGARGRLGLCVTVACAVAYGVLLKTYWDDCKWGDLPDPSSIGTADSQISTSSDPPDTEDQNAEADRIWRLQFDRKRALRERSRLSARFGVLALLLAGIFLAHRKTKSQSRASEDAPPSET